MHSGTIHRDSDLQGDSDFQGDSGGLGDPAVQLAPGAAPSGDRRPRLRWELIGCARSGHALPGAEVATVGDDDADLVRLIGGHR